MSDYCLITCITSDDEGRGYYCESCPLATPPPPVSLTPRTYRQVQPISPEMAALMPPELIVRLDDDIA